MYAYLLAIVLVDQLVAKRLLLVVLTSFISVVFLHWKSWTTAFLWTTGILVSELTSLWKQKLGM